MFIECYRIPPNDWGKPDEEIKKQDYIDILLLFCTVVK